MANSLAGARFERYELGIKWQALDNQLSVDAVIYQIEKRNVLTTEPVDATFSVSAGEVRSRGFDLKVAGNLIPQWRVIGGYAYVDAEVIKGNVIQSGTRLMNIPRNSFSLLNVYEFQDNALKLGLGAGVKYVDERAGKRPTRRFDGQLQRCRSAELLQGQRPDQAQSGCEEPD